MTRVLLSTKNDDEDKGTSLLINSTDENTSYLYQELLQLLLTAVSHIKK